MDRVSGRTSPSGLVRHAATDSWAGSRRHPLAAPTEWPPVGPSPLVGRASSANLPPGCSAADEGSVQASGRPDASTSSGHTPDEVRREGTRAALGAVDASAATGDDSDPSPGSRRRTPSFKVVLRIIAVAILVAACAIGWQRYHQGAPPLGDQGPVTASVDCVGGVTIDLPAGQVHSAPEEQAPWPQGDVAGRLHLSDRSRRSSTRWKVAGVFTGDDGSEVPVAGELGEDARWMLVSC